jgi:hypothetical protein
MRGSFKFYLIAKTLYSLKFYVKADAIQPMTMICDSATDKRRVFQYNQCHCYSKLKRGNPLMSHITETSSKKITAPQIHARKGGAPIVLTAYDYPTARIVDEAGFDFILVGDSLAQTVLGYVSTSLVTLEEMIAATRAVKRGVKPALIVGDMPFGYYQDSVDRGVASTIRFVKEGGARRAHIFRAIVEAEIPGMGHIGLTPQSLLKMGGYRVQGKTLKKVVVRSRSALTLPIGITSGCRQSRFAGCLFATRKASSCLKLCFRPTSITHCNKYSHGLCHVGRWK